MLDYAMHIFSESLSFGPVKGQREREHDRPRRIEDCQRETFALQEGRRGRRGGGGRNPITDRSCPTCNACNDCCRNKIRRRGREVQHLHTQSNSGFFLDLRFVVCTLAVRCCLQSDVYGGVELINCRRPRKASSSQQIVSSRATTGLCTEGHTGRERASIALWEE